MISCDFRAGNDRRALLDQILIEQTEIGEQAHRHERIDGGLELKQQIEIEPTTTEAHAPEDIVLTITQVVGDVAAADLILSPLGTLRESFDLIKLHRIE